VLAHQLHGGAGYVLEHPLHRHSLRAKQVELALGSAEQWLIDRPTSFDSDERTRDANRLV
jgi:alkylation response protein AidB-like acyl-CoA dehydrogenase